MYDKADLELLTEQTKQIIPIESSSFDSWAVIIVIRFYELVSLPTLHGKEKPSKRPE